MRIVVKVGTSTLIRENGSVDLHTLDYLSRTLSDVKGMGNQIILVSSGAIGVGTGKLGLKARPTELRMKQAVAAVGQCELMHLYDKFFGEYGQTVGQILLTGNDVDDPQRAENLTRTFDALLELGVVPIVNENDSVSPTEIERGRGKVFGDNDTLSATVAVLCRADLLVLFSDIDGLFDGNPHEKPDAKLVPRVYEIDEGILAMAGGVGGRKWGTGGMSTKLEAGRLAMANGIDMVIANGNHLSGLYDMLSDGDVGTRFVAAKRQ